MSWIKRLLYGLLVGITSIAPGISGGTIAIALGFYEHLINAIANLLKQFRKNFAFLLPFGIGALISMSALSVALDQLFTKAPLPTNALFIGLIMGTFPFIKDKFKSTLDHKKASGKHLATGIIFFIIVLIPVFINDGSSINGLSWGTESLIASVVTYLLIGIIISATMIIPGLSGTMIMMSLGLYTHLLDIASTSVTAAVSMDIPGIIALLPQLIPLGIGVIIGGFLIAKVLNKMFQAIPSYIYAAIIGLLCATPIVMLAQISGSEYTLINILVGIIALIAGLLLVKKFENKE